MVIILLAVVLGMVLAMPTNLAQRRRELRKQEALIQSQDATPPMVATTEDEFMTDESRTRFVQARARIMARAAESQSWKEAHAYVREKFRGAERRQLAHDLVREELACAERIAKDQKVLIRDAKFRKDLATLLQYTAMSGRWEEARAYVRKTYTGARQPIVLRALAKAEETAKAVDPSQKVENGLNEPEAHESTCSEQEEA